jgi:hypothetical protein
VSGFILAPHLSPGVILGPFCDGFRIFGKMFDAGNLQRRLSVTLYTFTFIFFSVGKHLK